MSAILDVKRTASGLSDEDRAALAEGLAQRRRPQPRPVTAKAGPTRCARCKETKPPEAFYKGGRANGLSSYCRECSKESARASAVKFRDAVREASAHVDVAPEEPGLCRAFVNLGAWSGRAQCSSAAAPGTGGYCLRHVPAERREIARSLRGVLLGTKPFGSEDFRKRREAEARAILEAAQDDPEIAALIDQQVRDERSRIVGARWHVSFDAPVYGDKTGHDLAGFGVNYLKGYVSDSWTDAVAAVVDHRREIDEWAEAA